MALQPIYQFYVELVDYQPKIWRRFQVMRTIPMSRLGYIIMTMFEMEASHLFCFDVNHGDNFARLTKDQLSEKELEKLRRRVGNSPEFQRYQINNEYTMDFAQEMPLEATQEKLYHVVQHVGDEMTFFYDYGDDWKIRVVLEKIIVDKELNAKELPRALAGEGHGIIEDCGGAYGLEEIAKAFAKKKGADYKKYCECLGVEDLDLASFDLDDMNFRLKKLPKIYADSYENFLEPTKKSLDLIDRKYKK